MIRNVEQIIDAAFEIVKLKLKERNRGKDKYQKRMKNREKLKKNRG